MVDLRDIKSPKDANSPVSYVVDIVNLSKSFRRHTIKGGYTTIKSSLVEFFLRRKRAPEQVTNAICDLTLRIPRGAAVGIIGRNGSGKSTFLKLLTGIYKPTTGKIQVHGRIAALIELGAGFHPDFTGRENLYLAGVMHGLTRTEIDDRFEQIVRFAELEDVIDDPVRTYSSGMYMRLGFSLAVHTDPDILLIDEVLAVGDARFVSKCKERLAALRREGKTLILVSHDMDAIERWCDEALWLNDGEVKDRGDPRRVIDHYREYVEKGEEQELFEVQEREEENSEESELEKRLAPERWGSREVVIDSVRLLDANGEPRLLLHSEDKVQVEVTYTVNESVDEVVFGIGINRNDGLVVHGSNTDIERVEMGDVGLRGTVVYEIERLGLLDGSYTIDVAVHRKDGYPYDYHKNAITFAVRWPYKQAGVIVPKHSWIVRPEAKRSAVGGA